MLFFFLITPYFSLFFSTPAASDASSKTSFYNQYHPKHTTSVFLSVLLLYIVSPSLQLLIHVSEKRIYHTTALLFHFRVSDQIPVHHTATTETEKADICHKDWWCRTFTLCILVWKNRNSFCKKNIQADFDNSDQDFLQCPIY